MLLPPRTGKSDTSRLQIPKIDVKFSKMVCPEQIWQRLSLTTPTIAKGLSSITH